MKTAIAFFFLALPPQAPPVVSSIRPPQAPLSHAVPYAPLRGWQTAYMHGYNFAVGTGLPFVICAGTYRVEGRWSAVEVPLGWEWTKGKTIVLALPNAVPGGDLVWAADLPATSTRADIQAAIDAARQRPAARLQKTPPMPYQAAYDRAYREQLPLVVFVGLEAQQGKWVGVEVPSPWQWITGYGVVVSVPGPDGYPQWLADVPAYRSEQDIQRAIDAPRQRRAVQAAPSPFAFTPQVAGQLPPRIADDEPQAVSFTVPDGFERYAPARMTQRIAVTDGRDTITPVPRASLEAKWQVSGGMEGIGGWHSTVYKKVPWHREGIIDLEVFNGKNMQKNRGWSRSYADGSAFLDVLSNADSGEIFEVRKAVKDGGAWIRNVEYRNRDARPAGYVPVAQAACVECHSKSGTGLYASAMIPGGDENFSAPFPALEH